MNWEQFEGKWMYFTGTLKELWGKLSNDEVTVIYGERDKFVGMLQQLYGLSKEQAEKDVEDFMMRPQ